MLKGFSTPDERQVEKDLAFALRQIKSLGETIVYLESENTELTIETGLLRSRLNRAESNIPAEKALEVAQAAYLSVCNELNEAVRDYNDLEFAYDHLLLKSQKEIKKLKKKARAKSRGIKKATEKKASVDIDQIIESSKPPRTHTNIWDD